jgi:hypothetical protein
MCAGRMHNSAPADRTPPRALAKHAPQYASARMDFHDVEEAAEYFRNAVKPEQWEQAVRVVRQPLGNLVSSEVKSATYKTTLPGVPDGEYVVIEFETAFENKKAVVETVTPMMDEGGKWRLSGYFIK